LSRRQPAHRPKPVAGAAEAEVEEWVAVVAAVLLAVGVEVGEVGDGVVPFGDGAGVAPFVGAAGGKMVNAGVAISAYQL
jgi:hypothetical protein